MIDFYTYPGHTSTRASDGRIALSPAEVRCQVDPLLAIGAQADGGPLEPCAGQVRLVEALRVNEHRTREIDAAEGSESGDVPLREVRER